MKVTHIKLRHASACELDAKVEAPGLLSRRSFPLFYRFPTEYAKSLKVSADPFIAALLVPSMLLGEPLIVDAPASPRLLRALPKIMGFYHSLDPTLKIIEVRTLGERKFQHANSTSKAEALFFSCGVDSFYALTKLTGSPGKNNLTHLMFVRGFDIKLEDASLFRRTRKAADEVASYYERKLVVAATNVREVTDEYASWNNCCGAVLASVALCLGAFFRRVYIASDLGPGETAPLAIHPSLDPLWSTDSTTFIHYTYGISRVEKARSLGNNPMAQKHLRVCYENRYGAYNCGRCSKCVRTMLALHLAGALSKFHFPTTLTPELVDRTDYCLDPSAITHAEQILHELQKAGEIQLANSLSRVTRKAHLIRPLEPLKVAMLKNKWGTRLLRFLAGRSSNPHGMKRSNV